MADDIGHFVGFSLAHIARHVSDETKVVFWEAWPGDEPDAVYIVDLVSETAVLVRTQSDLGALNQWGVGPDITHDELQALGRAVAKLAAAGE